MKSIYSLVFFLMIVLVSCTSKPSLQEYFVEHSENKNFIALDLSPTILNIDKSKLTPEENAALQSFKKMNILAFKRNDQNKAAFEAERTKVSVLLKDEKYQKLMKLGSGKEGVAVSFVGDDEHIQEFVLFANKKENGFAVIRILGKDMNPSSMMTLMEVLKKGEMNWEQLKPLQEILKN